MKEQRVKILWQAVLIFFLAFAGSLSVAEEEGVTIRSEVPGEADAESNLYLSVGPGIAIYSGNTGWALNLGGLFAATEGSNIFVGGDLALNFWSFDPVTDVGATSSSATGIQLLPSVIYRFDAGEEVGIAPYLGVSAGPYIYTESETRTVGGGATQTDSNTSLFLAALLRPGFFSQVTEALVLNGEAKFGLLNGDFIFLPQANVVVAL